MTACGCCEGTAVLTPADVRNRPGLSAIAYRVGTHAAFKESMLARLAGAERRALGRLGTRDDDDFAIAFLDGWAVIADVLTFYQERLANESYLRTATERRSVSELGRLIGYRLRPGVAASLYLAFTLEEGRGAPDQGAGDTAIPAGTQVQSTPGPGEKPQTFETIEAVPARAAWNAMRPRLTRRHPLDPDATELFFEGLATGLKAGDGLFVRLSSTDGVFRQVAKVTSQPALNRTRAELEPAPKAGRVPTPAGLNTTALGAVSAKYAAIGVVSAADFRTDALRWSFRPEDVFVNLTAARSQPPGVDVFRTRAAIFGHNAPDWYTLPRSLRVGEWDSEAADFVKGPYHDRKAKWSDASLDDYSDEISGTVPLDQVYPAVSRGSQVVLKDGAEAIAYDVSAVSEGSKADFAVTGKVTRLVLSKSAGLNRFTGRGTTVFAQPETLPLARLPKEEPVEGTRIDLEGYIDGLAPGQTVIVTGELQAMRGVTASEAITIAEVEHEIDDDGGTRIGVSPLTHRYVRSTVSIAGNAARATHGETVDEVLGSGDASLPFQQFALRQRPLTHVRATTPHGSASTLEIRVNDVRWNEVTSLEGCGPEDHVFATDLDDDGRVRVGFGDQVSGARLPSGQHNVRAKYRRGIGLDGMVRERQVNLLLSRPLGVRGVVNPMAAEGAADAEALEDARENAPLTVLTLDRVVSLRDYEHFARAFAGIAKARAEWATVGSTRTIVVTVAGAKGAAVSPGSATHGHLLAAIKAAGDPFVPVRVVSYRPAFFRVAAVVRRGPDHLATAVLLAIENALRSRYGFARRSFGEPVALSDVVATMQGVDGVVAVDVERFSRVDNAAVPLAATLTTKPLTVAANGVEAAELLTLDPGPLSVEVIV